MSQASPIARMVEASARHRGLVLLGGLALALGGAVAARRIPLDALPDLSDPQVVVFSEWPGRSPTLVEDQVTYPIVTSLVGAPRVVEVRGQSMFGMGFVNVVFEEGTDPYWARARVSEWLEAARARLPEGVEPRLGPDASGVGWVYQYALLDPEGRVGPAALRTLHDTAIRPALAGVRGVAEVASLGGAVPEYQVALDPARLRAQGITFAAVADAVRRSTGDVGGRLIELAEREHVVRGLGTLRGPEDLESVVLRRGPGGVPLTVGDVGTVRLGPALRRGATDWNGEGDVVSGIVVMRHGENALSVIERVEERIASLAPALPAGVRFEVAYDRSGLIERAIETLGRALGEEMIVVAAVILLFLLHFRSALIPIVSLPLSVLTAFIPMALFDIPATLMSLGGIAIAIGATVDAEIVMVEAAHKALEHAPADLPEPERRALLAAAAAEVTPAIFVSLLIIAVSFLPVFGLTGQAGRLFRPLALTKTFVMLSAALVSVTVAPALRDGLIRGTIRPEAEHPVSRAIRRVYEPFVHVALATPRTTLLIGLFAVLSALPLVPHLGHELMPTLDEGDLLYMPTTLPGISIEEARRQLQIQDTILRSFPEVQSVLGKVGRAETATDPAPLSMAETVVRLRPRSAWRTRFERRWYHGWAPSWMRGALGWAWPEFRPITHDELIDEMASRLRLPGWTNAFTQPIRNRIDMLSTGIRTPVGIKVHGHDLPAIERAGLALERLVRTVPGTRSVLFERQQGGTYLDVVPDRAALARHGLSVADVNDVVEGAVGGSAVTTVLDGRARLGVTVRTFEDFRGGVEELRETPVTPEGEDPRTSAVALGDVASVQITSGPPMVRDDSGLLVGYVYVDIDATRDLGSWVEDAQQLVQRAIARGDVVLPVGGHLRWTGQYEQMQEMEERLRLLVPLALLSVVLLLYLQFRDFTEVLIVLLSVPFALVGSVWAIYLLGHHLSAAVWVGIIALIGLATQTGVVMIVYIDQAYRRRLAEGRIRSRADIIEAHAEGTILRVRPKLMTVGTMLVGLAPLLWAEGSGADVMRRIAAPMVGGLVTSAFLTLELIPVIYTYWRDEQRIRGLLAAHVPAVHRELGRWITALRAGLAGVVAALAARLLIRAEGADALIGAAGVAGTATLVLSSMAYVGVRRLGLRHLPGATAPETTGDGHA